MKFLILLVLVVSPVLALSAPKPGCKTPLSALVKAWPVNLEKIQRPVFYPADTQAFSSFNKLRAAYDSKNPGELKEIRKTLKEEAGYAVEALPIIIDKEIWTMLKEAAAQRARAANAFLKDIYGSANPLFTQKFPSFKPIIESSPMFAHEIVGTEAAKQNPFDFTLAMDIVLTDNPDGTKSFTILEADSGSIGGNFRMAQVAQGLEIVWPRAGLFSDFLDARQSVFERMKRHAQNALARGGKSLLYTEEDPGFLPERDTHTKRWLNDHGILLASHWNKNEIKFNSLSNLYYFQGYPIRDFWLEYYTEPLDPLSPVYARVSEMVKTDPFEISHTLPGFWGNWLGGGFAQWHQHNPQGIEIFTDKAIAAAISMSEQLYLGKPSQLKNSYVNFLQDTPEATQAFINKIFAQPMKNTVIKSRRDTGQGAGVYIGRNMYRGKTKNNLTWKMLKAEVEKNPQDWVYQPYIQETPLVLADGRRRTFELRLITNFENGEAHVIDAVYIRSSAEGTMRNMSGTRDLDDLNAPSIIPVLIPR